MSARFDCFTTNTDTEIDKMLVSAALLTKPSNTGYRAMDLRPVVAGTLVGASTRTSGDIGQLRATVSVDLPLNAVCPWLLDAPTSPRPAVAREGMATALSLILDAFAHARSLADVVVVGDVGGFHVPLSDDFDTIKMAVALGLSVAPIVRLRLGYLNRATLTAEAIAACDLHPTDWASNVVDAPIAGLDNNVAALCHWINAPHLGTVPQLPHIDTRHAATHIDIVLLLTR